MGKTQADELITDTRNLYPGVKEEWATVPGFPEYQFSNLGRTRSRRRKASWTPIDPLFNRNGYLRLQCYRDNPDGTRDRKFLMLHLLVARKFIGDSPKEGMEVNHISGDKTDCSMFNLEWVTAEENVQHAYAIGLNPRGGGRTLTDEDVQLIRKMRAHGHSLRTIAKKFDISKSMVSQIAHRKKWRGL